MLNISEPMHTRVEKEHPSSDIVIDATTASVASIISPSQWVARNTAMHLDG